MTRGNKAYSPKRVVYLLGAGATQAEANYKGGESVNLLMKDLDKLGEGISSRIIKEAKTLNIKIGGKDEIDVEKLISLLANTGEEKHRKAAEELRRLYYEDILKNLGRVGLLEKPELAVGLFEMHKNELFNKKTEKLSGIISLNHDNLFQVASQKVYSGINLGFRFQSTSFKSEKDAPLIIQLHGSFNWRNGLPLKIEKLGPTIKYRKNLLWIPPAILKESKDYPYNKLSGLAYEILKKCEILRIIGCSLSQNDWNVVSLLFNAQYSQLLYNDACFRIELIMDQKPGELIKKECSYLQNIVPIGYLTEGDFSAYLKDEERAGSSELDNPFLYWLRTKVQYHIRRKEIDVKDVDKTLKVIMET